MPPHLAVMALEIARDLVLDLKRGKFSEIGGDEVEAAIKAHPKYRDLTDYEKEWLTEAAFERFVKLVATAR